MLKTYRELIHEECSKTDFTNEEEAVLLAQFLAIETIRNHDITLIQEEKLKEINKRLYYDNIKGYNLDEFDRNDIQRTLKLTEFVVMERAKKKYLFRSAKNNYTSIIKRINRNKND